MCAETCSSTIVPLESCLDTVLACARVRFFGYPVVLVPSGLACSSKLFRVYFFISYCYFLYCWFGPGAL